MVGVLLLAACGDDDSDGQAAATNADPAGEADLLGPEDQASGEPVRIGYVSDGATPTYDTTDELRTAAATVDFLNEHRGGIGGRPIELVTCETKQDPAAATDCANQMVEQDVVAVTLAQSGVAESVWEPLHAAGIPTMWFLASGQDTMTDQESSFVLTNPLTQLFGLPISVAESEGADKIAFVTIDVPAAKTPMETIGPSILEQAGLDYDDIYVPPGTADMTSQMQEIVDGGAGVVQILGPDSFCIAAMQGLQTAGYEGAITSNIGCLSDATREAMGDSLEGMFISSPNAVGAADDPTYELYRAVVDTYADDVEQPDTNFAIGGYTVVSALATSLDGISGDITPQSVVQTIKAMSEQELPAGGGGTFRCGGSAIEMMPAVCTNQWLRTQLDSEGQPTTYEVVDSTDILP